MNEYKKPYYILFNAALTLWRLWRNRISAGRGGCCAGPRPMRRRPSWRPGRRTAEKRLDGGANL